MEKIENGSSLANLILPRVETKKVSHVQDGFKGALERGREKAEEDRNSARVNQRLKKEVFAKDQARDQREKQTGKKIGKPWERPRPEKASEQKERVSDESVRPPEEATEPPVEAKNLKETLSADGESKKIDERINDEESSGSERAFEALQEPAQPGQIPMRNTNSGNPEFSEDTVRQGAPLPGIDEILAKEAQPETKGALSEESEIFQGSEVFGERAEDILPAPAEKTAAESFATEGALSAEKGGFPRSKAEADLQMPQAKSQEDLGRNEVRESRKISQFQSGSIQEDIRNLMRAGEAENPKESFLSFSEEEERGRESLFVLSDARVRAGISSSALHPAKTLGADRSEASLAAKVLDEVRISFGQNKNEMKIQLHPETLGKLTVKLSSENGVMNASFFAENDKAKQMIEAQMAELRRTLETQGIQVQNLSVTVDSGKEELSRHKNIMEAKKYSKLSSAERQADILEVFAELQNPYVLEDEFSEMV